MTPYSYDRTASERAEVAIRYEGGWGYISVLVGSGLLAWKKQYNSDEEAGRELEALKTEIEGLTGDEDAIFDKASDLVDAAKFRIGQLSDRDPELARKQYALHQIRDKAEAQALRKWLRDWVVEFVEDTYKKFKNGQFRKEPCVTAGYVRGWILEGGAAPQDKRKAFEKLTTRQQFSACHYALEQARKAGKLQSAIGMGRGGQEARCYEPAS